MSAMGVDVGGTFTDVVFWDGDSLRTAKVPSTPADQSVGVIDGADRLAGSVELFLHGTTVATNALLERTGAVTGLVTSPGFEDVLEIGRQDRPSLYDPDAERPPPLVPRSRRFPAVPSAGLADVEAVAVSLLYAYGDPSAEREMRTALLEENPGLFVSLSSEVTAEFREYERTSTTVLNAYVAPVMARYLRHLEAAVTRAGLADRVSVMRSSGGVMSAKEAARLPAAALLSGPAGGVVAATELGRLLERDHLISFDMGGTSTDVCSIDAGRPDVSFEREIAGYPCRLPSVAIHTVGAGGGSIGWVDAGGALRVGPRSAGADPGPACYGKGGIEPTITDADVVLGRIDPASRFGADLTLRPDSARKALATLAESLRMSVDAVATGMVDIAEEIMAGAIRTVSIERGADPRNAFLVAFGGAGGLHATALARRLNMAGVLIPAHAGVFSAFGLLLSPPRLETARTVLADRLEEVLMVASDLRGGVSRDLQAAGVPPVRVATSVDVRYVGQSHEVSVDYQLGDSWTTVADRFHRAHQERNGFARPQDRIEVVTVRATAIGEPAVRWDDLPAVLPQGEASRGERAVLVRGRQATAEAWWRPALAPGRQVVGPAIIEEPEATTFLDEGERARVHASGTLEVEW